MRLKYLLIAGLMFGAASAYAGETTYIFEGSMDSLYGYSDVSERFEKKDNNNHWLNNFYLNLGVEHEFNDTYKLGVYVDLMAGIDKEIDNFNNGSWGQEVYTTLDTPFGQLAAGETYNVAAQFHTGAPEVGALGINNSDIVDFISNPNWTRKKHKTSFETLNSTAMNTDGVAAKINYITPEIYNTLLGITYVPDSYDRRGLINKYARYASDDAFIAALYNETDLGFADMAVSAGYGVYHRDDKEFTVGMSLSRGGWTLGGSFRKTYVDGDDYTVTETSDNPRLPDLFDNYREGIAWDIGLSYELGPYEVSLSYFKSKADNTSNEDEIIMLSNKYQVDKNIDIYLTAAHVDFEGNNNSVADNNQGYAFVTGLSISF